MVKESNTRVAITLPKRVVDEIRERNKDKKLSDYLLDLIFADLFRKD